MVIGILAHVDAGKTTLSEAMLYFSGTIRQMGRVDNRDAFLDTYELERSRGITIFSKQAVFTLGGRQITLLDTPGHVDFSAEMERTLQVLDVAVLVINGMDGVQGHTLTLWRLLKKYSIPVFIFVNKMDQAGTDKEALLKDIKGRLNGECIDFTEKLSGGDEREFYENIAVAEEEMLDIFLEQGKIAEEEIRRLVAERKIFPCFFGSALKAVGIDEFLLGLQTYTREKEYPEEFGAKVFKISRDNQGNRLTFLKVTGGKLRARAVITGGREGSFWEEKVNQLRIYSGEKYTQAEEAGAGTVCAVTGLNYTRPGEGLGMEMESFLPVLEPVLTYKIELPPECDAALFLPKLRQLEEEEPQLHLVWDETVKEIQAKIMGEVQTEILKSLILERFGVNVTFGAGNIVYKETISRAAEGVGHFEPLRHYAEVHLLLEPGEAGSGLVFSSDCSEDVLERNWQRLVLTHLEEKEHKGVLTGAPITDMKITLIGGKAHQKHTEGGDFRQASYRAVRQGLMEAESVLLEPYYDFRLEVPGKMLGRAMADLEKRGASFSAPDLEEETAVLTGFAPVASMQDYPREVTAYTKGYGKLFCTLRGYEPCHNEEEIIERSGYVAQRDTENPAGSIFCAHGAGFFVEWDEVKDYMHVESCFSNRKYGGAENNSNAWAQEGEYDLPLTRNERKVEGENSGFLQRKRRKEVPEEETGKWLGTEEVDAILEKALYANKSGKRGPGKGKPGNRKNANAVSGIRIYGGQEAEENEKYRKLAQKPEKKKERYLLVDGYNIIFAWDELKELAKVSIDGARGRLMDILCNYQGIRKCHLILVFDAYRVQGHDTEIFDFHNIHVVYTKEAETADQYIEKFAYEHGNKDEVTVATSDGLEQIIIRGKGCALFSARELKEEIERASEEIQRAYGDKTLEERNYLLDGVDDEIKKELENLRSASW
ncbi:tetracycline resistance protein TetO [Lachnospiraceae bacterium]|nr:tetracycline resistance protein TetO [Lachnospiraceae bacterium]